MKELNITDCLRKFFSLMLMIRISKPLTAISGIYFKTKYDYIEVDITYDCNLKCINCNRSCRQAPSKEFMTVKQIEKFVKESTNQKRKWKGIRILGGEPSLHPDILTILHLILEYKKASPDTVLKFATNGFGLMTNNILKKVPKEFIVENSQKTTLTQNFFPFNFAPIDSFFYNFADYSNACRITEICGLGLNKHGYYQCAIAGGIDRVLGLDIGRKKLPFFGDPMIKEKRVLCKYCGYFRELIGTKSTTKEIISKTWQEVYLKYSIKPPSLKIY